MMCGKQKLICFSPFNGKCHVLLCCGTVYRVCGSRRKRHGMDTVLIKFNLIFFLVSFECMIDFTDLIGGLSLSSPQSPASGRELFRTKHASSEYSQ